MLAERRPLTDLGEYDTNDDELSLLTCLNNDDCKVVDVDKVPVKEIANMLLEHPPTLWQVWGVRRAHDVNVVVFVILVRGRRRRDRTRDGEACDCDNGGGV
jgi:hypothetical protein